MRYRILIFDLDGTLFRSFLLGLEWCLRVARERGLPTDHGIVALIAKYWGGPTKLLVNACWPEVDPAPFQKAFNEFNATTFMPIFPGIPEALQKLLRKNCLLAAYTGRDRIGTMRVLCDGGIRDKFSIIRCRDDVKNGKPDPEGLVQIIEPFLAIGISPDEIAMVGDSVHADLPCAEDAGIGFIAALEDDNADPAEFERRGVFASHRVGSVRDLPSRREA
jgi:phosphoglycolate phosphatase-like HAD superfamily hydrolase